jgi:oligopeptide transport system substrate-binding protein
VINMSGTGTQILPLAQWLYQETDGNPFFLIESVKALFEGGKLQLKEGVWQGAFQDVTAWQLKVPVSVSQLIQSRLSRLDQNALDTLRLASVIGREFDFDLLSMIQDQGEEGTLTAIDHLLRSRLIEEGQTPVESDYVFSHHLVHEVVYQSIPARHKSRNHVLVAQALEQRHLEHRSRSSVELAYHYLRAGTTNQHYVEKSIAYSIESGDQARMLYAHQEAIDHYQRALNLLDQERDYERAARTLMKIASTYHNAFDFKSAQKSLEESFEMWKRASKKQSRLKITSVNKTLRLPWQDPLSLDPTKAFNIYAWGIAKQLFSRLIEFGPDGEIIPDIAKTWEVTEDGKKYVFHLRDDVHWSDGTPLTAGDFEFGWKRLLDPATGWIHASLMYDIKGGRAFHQGEIIDPDFVCVNAQNATTLVVELEKPTGYFLYLLGYVCPVPRHILKKFGESWAEGEHIVTSGAFQVKDCCRTKFINLTRNPNYYGKFVGNVKSVILKLLPLQEWQTMLELYQGGKLDTLDLTTFPPQEIEVIRSRFTGEYLSGSELLTYSLGFNTSVTPFNDHNIRLAFAHAIDRDLMIENLYRNAAMVANGGFIPPGMPGHSRDIGLAYNPDRARDLLAEAGYPGGFGFPKVHALYLDTPYRMPIFKYLQHQWSNILGIEICWEAVDWGEYVSRIENSPPHISAMRWIGQYYPDPDDFMKVGMSHARIFTKWENQHYDALVEQARRLTDQSKRINLYTQADRILIDEVALFPLFYGRIELLIKPHLKGFRINRLSSWSFKDIIVDYSQI